MTIISLHLPKTAGTSFKASLEDHFGPSYRDDYADQAISKSAVVRAREALAAAMKIDGHGLEGVECVHGHFMPVKYLLHACRRPLTFVTWMREPAARMLSHYYYWQDSYDRNTSAAHHREVVEHAWTLEQFCFSKRFQNIYTQYLWGFPLENFSFIGISEYYAEDFRYFSKHFLKTPLEPLRQNTTSYTGKRARISDAFMQEVREFHSADTKLYLRAIEWRKSRLAVVKTSAARCEVSPHARLGQNSPIQDARC